MNLDGRAGALAMGAGLLIFGALACGEATMALQGGAARADPGWVTFGTDAAQTAMSYGSQQLVGGGLAVLGILVFVGGSLTVWVGNDDDPRRFR